MVRCSVTQIEFFNQGIRCPSQDLYNDMTEFDTHNEEELAQLWWEFCKENDLISVYKTTRRVE